MIPTGCLRPPRAVRIERTRPAGRRSLTGPWSIGESRGAGPPAIGRRRETTQRPAANRESRPALRPGDRPETVRFRRTRLATRGRALVARHAVLPALAAPGAGGSPRQVG